MKRFSFTMLLILSFTIFSVYIVQAQQMMTDSTNQAKKKGVFPIYIQSSGGFTLDGGYCCSANYLFTMSIGYRMSEKAAIGISKTNFQVDDEVKGFGLEYRMTPSQRVIFAAEIGVIDNVIYGQNHFPSDQRYDYLPNQSQNYYFRLSAGYRFWRIFSFNLNYAQSGNIAYDYSKMYYGNGTHNTVFVEKISKQTQIMMFTLGLNLPIYSK
jgi:hypothetical protein